MMPMRAFLVLCVSVLASAGDTLLAPGSYSRGVSAESGLNSAGVYATKCRHCSGVLSSGRFVPDLEWKRGLGAHAKLFPNSRDNQPRQQGVELVVEPYEFNKLFLE